VLLYEVTDQKARETAASVDSGAALRRFIREIARPWHSHDFLIVKRVLPTTPVTGQVCRRFLEAHPPTITPSLDDIPVPPPLGNTTGLERRGPHLLTPIEVPIYDRLAETGLTFSAQPFLQQADDRVRPDFLVLYDGGVIAVELDGHDWHKTKEQRGKDASKQNWLAARKITTVRFTGSQVFADPDGCMAQIMDIVRSTPARP
jgi:very-short-patch-repair endonuclease